jgi:hypothetical protein
MTDRIRLNRKQANTPIISNPLLAPPSQATSVDSSVTHAVAASYDLSRVTPFYQAKLEIGQPGDAYELEADKVAEQVMDMPEPKLAKSTVTNSVQQNRSIDPIQRVCNECQDETKEESLPAEESDRIQAKEEAGQTPELTSVRRQMDSADDPQSGSNLESQLNASKGGGSPLSDDVRSFMEPRFGADFSGVRVHTGSDSVQMNRDVNAQAFAHGQDVYFGAGKAPGKDALTAHELTHVVQQTGGVQTKPLIMRQDASTPTNAPVPSAKPADSTSEAFKKIFETHWFWMKKMLEDFKKLDKNLLGEMQKIVDTVPGIYHERSRIAIEAALRVEFSAASIEWLKTNIKPDGKIDQVAEVRDFMGVDAFDKSSNSLLTAITQEIQNIYSERNKNERDEQSKAGKSKITYSTDSPVGAEEKLKELKILSPLAEIQLRAVIEANKDLVRGRSASDVRTKSGIDPTAAWCGGFAQTSYDPPTALVKPGLIKWYLQSTQKAYDFFNYLNNYVTQKYIKEDGKWMSIKQYHEDRGSVRTWIDNSKISAGGNLDIRPGDIVTIWNKFGGNLANGDHIQMVQSWDPKTRILLTIAGNDGGYKISHNPAGNSAATGATGVNDEKIKKIEEATGFTLTPRNDYEESHIAVDLRDLSEEINVVPEAPPKKTDSETPEQKSNREEKQKAYNTAIGLSKDAVLQYLKKNSKDPTKPKESFIRGIGRPSLVDFEKREYK